MQFPHERWMLLLEDYQNFNALLSEVLEDFIDGSKDLSHSNLARLIQLIGESTELRYALVDIVAAQDDDLLLRGLLKQAIEALSIEHQIPEYVDVLELQGRQEAVKRYPELVQHISQCGACQEHVRMLSEIIHEDDYVSLFPLLKDTSCQERRLYAEKLDILIVERLLDKYVMN